MGVFVCVYIHTFVWRPKVNVVCLLHHFQLYSFWHNLFRWTWSSSIGLGCWPVSSWELPLSVLSAGTTGACCHTWLFLCVPTIWSQVLMLARPSLYWLSHLLSHSEQQGKTLNVPRYKTWEMTSTCWFLTWFKPLEKAENSDTGRKWETAAQKANPWHTYSLCWDPSQGPL